MSYIDVTFIEPVDLAEMGGVTVEEAEAIIQFAEAAAERIEQEKAKRRRKRKVERSPHIWLIRTQRRRTALLPKLPTALSPRH